MAEASVEMTPIEAHMHRFLNQRQPPKTFCPSEVARSLTTDELRDCGADDWRALMPQIRELAWSMRDSGQCEVLQKGDVLGSEVALEDVRGPIRLRRTSS